MVKKIHYCWFGGKELPRAVKKCIKTWKKVLPDYEIKEWNENNFDINCCPFVKEAYENKKWAFVSDYVRIYALYKEGGIYLDTDVKILKDISHVTDKDMFLGFEDSGYMGTAVIGVKEKENKYIKEILDYYNQIEHFNLETIYNYVNPVIITRIIKQYECYTNEEGIKIYDNDVYVYPRDYFFPLSYDYSEKKYTKNTCMVHLFNATWTDKGEKRTVVINRKFGPSLGSKINGFINGCFNFKNRIIIRIKKIYNWARMKYSIYINRGKRIKRLITELANIKSDYITICHPEKVKENEQIDTLFDENTIFIREMHTKKEAKLVAQTIINSGKKMIIFNSYTPGWEMIMSELKALKGNIICKILVYGGNGILAEDENWEFWHKITDLYNKGYIDEFGFFKKSLCDFYQTKGFKTKHLIKYVDIKSKEKYIKDEEKKSIKVGIYEAYDTTIKNSYNQLCAVSLLENAKLEYFPINYKVTMFARKFNINLIGGYGELSKEEIYKKMANNDINLNVSLVDEDNLLPLESLELGTISIVGSNFELFKNSELEKYIVVKEDDNITEIYNKIQYALEYKTEILDLYKKWKKKNILDAKEKVKEFIAIN